MTLCRPAALWGLISILFPASMAYAQDVALTPPDLECSLSGARSRAARLAPALRQGFGVQYWGEGYDAATLATQPHGLLILETTTIGAPFSETGREVLFSPPEIAAIRRDGTRPALGYLNVSEIETYRDYWVDQIGTTPPDPLPDWYGPTAEAGDHLAAFWTEGWRQILLERVDRLMQAGVDGLFLDDVLHYYSHALDDTLRWPKGPRPDAPAGAPALANKMMDLVREIAGRARLWNCDALIMVNNGVFIGRDAAGAIPGPEGRAGFGAYLEAIDAVMVENLSAPTTHAHTLEALQQDYLAHGVAVLSLDVESQFPDQPPRDLRRAVTDTARRSGAYPYIAADAVFNRLSPPIRLP